MSIELMATIPLGRISNPTRKYLVETPAQRKVDALQQVMEGMETIECPVFHKFTPGLYIRECHVPKGTILISKIHKSEHPFVITKGEVSVWMEGEGVVRLKAPFHGVTKPGTRRILYIHEDIVWTTYHPSDETDLIKLEEQLIESRNVKLTTKEIELCLGYTLE